MQKFLKLFFLLFLLPIRAQQITIPLIELDELHMQEESDIPYVYLSRDYKNSTIELYNRVTDYEWSDAVKDMCDHMKRGYLVADYDAVAHALEESLSVVNTKDDESFNDIKDHLREYKSALVSGQALITYIDDAKTRGSCPSKGFCCLFVRDCLQVNGTLTVSGQSIFNNNVIINGNGTVSGDVTVRNLTVNVNALIKGDETVLGNLFVSGNEEVDGTLTVCQNVNVQGNVNSQGSGCFAQGTIGAPTCGPICPALPTRNKLRACSLPQCAPSHVIFTVYGDVSAENEILSGCLQANSITTGHDINACGDLNVEGSGNFGDDITIQGNLDILGDVTSDLTVDGNVILGKTMSNTVAVTGPLNGTTAVFTGAVSTGALTSASLNVTPGGANIAGTLNAMDTVNAMDGLVVMKGANISNSLGTGLTVLNGLVADTAIIGPNPAMPGTTFLTVNGDAEVEGTLNAEMDVNVGGDLTVTGLSSLNGGASIVSGLNVIGGLTSDTLTVPIVYCPVTIEPNPSVPCPTPCGGDALTVVGNAEIEGDLTVEGNLTVNGIINGRSSSIALIPFASGQLSSTDSPLDGNPAGLGFGFSDTVNLTDPTTIGAFAFSVPVDGYVHDLQASVDASFTANSLTPMFTFQMYVSTCNNTSPAGYQPTSIITNVNVTNPAGGATFVSNCNSQAAAFCVSKGQRVVIIVTATGAGSINFVALNAGLLFTPTVASTTTTCP